MTQVGHTLTGLAIGIACTPDRKLGQAKLLYIIPILFGFLANIPDLSVKNWGHNLYYFSHSIFVNTAIILLLFVPFIFLKRLRVRVGGWIIITGASLAWLSHLLLDTFYSHGKGLLMFWPFSGYRLALPIPWFSVVHITSDPLTREQTQSLLAEFAFYGIFLLTVILLKRIDVKRRKPCTNG